MDNKHLNNFIFLAVLIAVVLFSHYLYAGNNAAGLADVTASTGAPNNASHAQIPLFVMPPSTLSTRGNFATGTAGSADTNGALAAQTASTGTRGVSAAGATPTVSAFVKSGAGAPPDVAVQSYIVADLQTGTVFASKNPDERWPTASLTKLMTATVVEDSFATTTSISITNDMFAVDPQDETTLVVGGTYSVPDLIHTMLMPSSNVAAEAFADFYGYQAFMTAMNARAKVWGMTNTYYDDPSGLSASNESTADDFLKLAQVIYKQYPEIYAITRTPQIYITNESTNTRVLVKSINDFAGDPSFVGGKTGYTPQANENLVSVFNYDGHPLFIVVLGTENRFLNTTALYNWFKANYR